MTLSGCSITVELREVSLRAKPEAMLALSAKATVPVLQLSDKTVLDESLDIMYWVLAQSDPDQWLDPTVAERSASLIAENDGSFKGHLDHYKYWERYPADSQQDYRAAAEVFLQRLELLLEDNSYLLGARVGITDIAIFPFIRQFAFVDKDWFDQSPYPKLRAWLEQLLNSKLFLAAMKKSPPWQDGDSPISL